MSGPEEFLALVSSHGLPVVGLIALIEGPIITVLAAWAASLGVFAPWTVFAVVVAADLAGDLVFYALGRRGIGWLPPAWARRIGLRPARLRLLTRQFRDRGGRMLLLGKVTHSAGALVLVAAGAAQMRLLPFFWFNLLATLPKSLLFFALGWFAGHAWERIDRWITHGSLILLLLLGASAALIWFRSRRVAASAASSLPGTRGRGSARC